MTGTVARVDEALHVVGEAEATAQQAGRHGDIGAGSVTSPAVAVPASTADREEGTEGQTAADTVNNDNVLELRRRIQQLQAERHKWLKENRKRLAERNRLRDQLRELETSRGKPEAGAGENGDDARAIEAPAGGELDSSGVEVLKTQLGQLTQERDALSQALAEEKVRSALLTALAAARARDPQIAYRAADKSRLSVSEDGAVSGIDEVVEELRQVIPELFEPAVPISRLALGGRKPRRTDQKPVFTRAEIRQIIRSGRWGQLRPEVLAAHRENRVIE